MLVDNVAHLPSRVIDFNNHWGDLVIYGISYYGKKRKAVNMLQRDYTFPSGHTEVARVPIGWLTIHWGYPNSRGTTTPITKTVLITYRTNKVIFGTERVGSRYRSTNFNTTRSGNYYNKKYKPILYAR